MVICIPNVLFNAHIISSNSAHRTINPTISTTKHLFNPSPPDSVPGSSNWVESKIIRPEEERRFMHHKILVIKWPIFYSYQRPSAFIVKASNSSNTLRKMSIVDADSLLLPIYLVMISTYPQCHHLIAWPIFSTVTIYEVWYLMYLSNNRSVCNIMFWMTM